MDLFQTYSTTLLNPSSRSFQSNLNTWFEGNLSEFIASSIPHVLLDLDVNEVMLFYVVVGLEVLLIQ